MPNELINLRELVSKKMVSDLNDSLKPIIAEMKAAGLTDDEINLAINRAFFDEFRGLHGFPASHRP